MPTANHPDGFPSAIQQSLFMFIGQNKEARFGKCDKSGMWSKSSKQSLQDPAGIPLLTTSKFLREWMVLFHLSGNAACPEYVALFKSGLVSRAGFQTLQGDMPRDVQNTGWFLFALPPPRSVPFSFPYCQVSKYISACHRFFFHMRTSLKQRQLWQSYIAPPPNIPNPYTSLHIPTHPYTSLHIPTHPYTPSAFVQLLFKFLFIWAFQRR